MNHKPANPEWLCAGFQLFFYFLADCGRFSWSQSPLWPSKILFCPLHQTAWYRVVHYYSGEYSAEMHEFAAKTKWIILISHYPFM